ncbi:MAG TPA: hypothetical protein VNK49_09995 [Anaerolineales bacterium]|nr:hypothetical protein [Anaerolineales bacterium]
MGYRRLPGIFALLCVSLFTLVACQGEVHRGVATENSIEELVGKFVIIRNGHDRYFLFDENGKSFELLFDDDLLRDQGGALALDRKHVKVWGVWIEETTPKFKVRDIEVVN